MKVILLIWVLLKSGDFELYKVGFDSWPICLAARDHMIRDRGYSAECVAAGQSAGRAPPAASIGQKKKGSSASKRK